MKKEIIKYTALLVLSLSSCTQVNEIADDIGKKDSVVSGTVTPKDETIPAELTVLAWGEEHPTWDNAVYDAIDSLGDVNNMGIKTPCKRLLPRDCAAQLISIIAKRESNFKTETSFNETGHLQGVVSRGLLQISKDSANQSAYGCNIKDTKDLHNPVINLKCGVKILAYQSKKTGSLMDGCSKYWSVCRSKDGTSKSYKEITTYMSQF